MPGPRKRLGVLPVRFRVSELGFREFVCLSVVVKNFTVNSVVLVRVLITPKTAVYLSFQGRALAAVGCAAACVGHGGRC